MNTKKKLVHARLISMNQEDTYEATTYLNTTDTKSRFRKSRLYLLTFETEDNVRKTFFVSKSCYDKMEEGMMGPLEYRGNRFLSFCGIQGNLLPIPAGGAGIWDKEWNKKTMPALLAFAAIPVIFAVFLLSLYPFSYPMENTLEGVQWENGASESLAPVNVTIHGVYRNYVFEFWNHDYFEGQVTCEYEDYSKFAGNHSVRMEMNGKNAENTADIYYENSGNQLFGKLTVTDKLENMTIRLAPFSGNFISAPAKTKKDAMEQAERLGISYQSAEQLTVRQTLQESWQLAEKQHSTGAEDAVMWQAESMGNEYGWSFYYASESLE